MTDIQLFPGDQAPRHSSTILAQIKDEKLEMGVEEPSVEKDTRTLHLVRRGNYLAHSFDEQLILTVVATDIRALFGKIIDRIVDVYPSLDKEKTLEELVERESAFPTTLGQGVAIPHVYSSTLKRRICAVARVPNGIHFTADTDREPIKLVFLLISPNGDPEGHLATLSEIARTLGREGMAWVDKAIQVAERHNLAYRVEVESTGKPSIGETVDLYLNTGVSAKVMMFGNAASAPPNEIAENEMSVTTAPDNAAPVEAPAGATE